MPRFSNWRMTPRALFRLLLALVLALAYAYQSRAQEVDGELADELAEDVQELVAPTSAAVRAALNSLEARAPSTPTEWIQAVNILRRMEAYVEAQKYLDQAINARLDEAALVQLHADIGTGELVRLSMDTNLPEAREFVLAVFETVRTAKRRPSTLQNLVSALRSPNAREQERAVAKLVEVGAFAIPPLASASSEPQGLPENRVASVVEGLGLTAEEPLLALLGSTDPKTQAFAVKMLASVKSKRASLHLLRLYFLGAPETQRAAANYFKDRRQVPPHSPNDAATQLQQRAKFHLEGNPAVRADINGLVEVWTWNGKENTVSPQTVTADAASAIAAARFARDAYDLAPSVQSQQLLLASRLQVDQLLGGIDQLLPREEGSAFSLGVEFGPQLASQTLDYCLRHGHSAAAQGACELLGYLCQNRSSANWGTLSKALQAPNRRVRYAAVRAVMQVDPRQRYAGAGYFQDALMDLANAQGFPHAVVCMHRDEASDDLSGKLSSMGFQVTQYRRSVDLLQQITKTSDIDVIFLSDSVSRPAARETLQRLRLHPNSKLVPVVVMARPDNSVQANRIASVADMTWVLPELASEEGISAVLQRVEMEIRDRRASPSRRLAHAQDALGWLSHLAKYSQTYSWYDLQRAEPVAIQASNQSALRELSLPLLGYLGSQESQQRLVQLVGQKGAESSMRQLAANAFTEAVSRRGLQLKGEQVIQQYDRYNASENEGRAAQEALGQILDVIETQTRINETKVPAF